MMHVVVTSNLCLILGDLGAIPAVRNCGGLHWDDATQIPTSHSPTFLPK